jgi:hypothetical protein
LIEVIKQVANEKPFLGICLGLQLLFDHSQENGGTEGLSILAGDVVHFPENELKIPHMGWNKVKQTQEHPLWYKIENNARFYSVHSYYVEQGDSSVVAGSSDYGNKSCKPKQIPKKGFSLATCLITSIKLCSSNAFIQAPIAPCPGNTIRSALRINAASSVKKIWSLGATCANAFCTLRTLPIP